MNRRAYALILLLAGVSSVSAAQEPPLLPPDPAPIITREADGNATVRAIRLEAPLRIDGRLDEAVYSRTTPISDFIQTLSRNGEAPTRTDRGVGDVRRH